MSELTDQQIASKLANHVTFSNMIVYLKSVSPELMFHCVSNACPVWNMLVKDFDMGFCKPSADYMKLEIGEGELTYGKARATFPEKIANMIHMFDISPSDSPQENKEYISAEDALEIVRKFADIYGG